MPTKSALETLIDLAKKNSDALAKRLGESLEATKKAREKLNTLAQFREDYSNRLLEAMRSGISPDSHRNYSIFIAKLDSALLAQKQDIEFKESASQRIRSEWQASEMKRLSYTTLESRKITAAQVKELKREQKASDEQAARITLNKSKSW